MLGKPAASGSSISVVARRPARATGLLAVLIVGAVLGAMPSAPRPLAAQDLSPPPPPEKTEDVKRWLERVAGLRTANPLQRDHSTVRTAFTEVVAECRLSTVRVLGDDGQLVLGTIVDPNGFILTKASELRGKLVCALADGRKLPAEIVGVDEGYDLALLRVAARGLTAVRWADSIPTVGCWLATPNQDRIPAAIGIVSNSPRSIPAPIGFLGVGLDDQKSLVTHVYPGMAAEKAGLRVHDLVVSISGKPVPTRERLQAEIRRRQPGQTLDLLVQRGAEQLKIQVVLGDAPTAATNERIEFQNRLGGQLSQRRAGFPSVLQHDTVLRPNECGGPLVDLDGRTVAINIARAGRVASFAVPASVVLPLLEELKSGKLNPQQVVSGVAGPADGTMPTSVTKP